MPVDKSLLEIVPQSTLEDMAWNELDKHIRESIEPIWKQETRQLENILVEEITRAEPEWVKERRLDYLRNNVHNLLEEAYPLMDLISEEELPIWLIELLLENELAPGFKKIYVSLWETKMWNTKEFIEPMELINTEMIKTRYGIVEIIERYGVKLRRTGTGRWVGCCPFHNEKTPSFMVYEKGDAHCFGCGMNIKDVIDWVMKMEKCDFKRACKILS